MARRQEPCLKDPWRASGVGTYEPFFHGWVKTRRCALKIHKNGVPSKTTDPNDLAPLKKRVAEETYTGMGCKWNRGCCYAFTLDPFRVSAHLQELDSNFKKHSFVAPPVHDESVADRVPKAVPKARPLLTLIWRVCLQLGGNYQLSRYSYTHHLEEPPFKVGPKVMFNAAVL